METLINKVRQALESHDWLAVTSLVAVSGGADSVALLRCLDDLRQRQTGRLLVVHFNHRLRGDAANRDQAFVEGLAQECGLSCIVGQASDTEPITGGDSLEASARAARYAFFQATADQQGARYLWTAHTADDQAETILHRIVRGTGLAGLAGIPPARPLSPLTIIARPMLNVTRAEVLAYLEQLGQPYCDDATNTDRAFTRNRLRHDLLPLLAKGYNPQVGDALRQLGALASEAQGVIDGQVGRLAAEACQTLPNGGVHVSLPALRAAVPYLVRELFIHLWQAQAWPLQAMNYDKWHELAALALSSTDDIRIFPGHIRAQKKGEQLMLSRPV